MNRFLLLTLAIALATFTTSCNDDDDTPLVGDGVINVSNFDAIEVSGVISLNVTQGSTQSVTVRGGTTIFNAIDADVSGGVLDLRVGGSLTTGATIDIVMPNLTDLEATGTGSVAISGFTNLTDLDMEVTGTTVVTITNSNATDFDCIVSGTGNIEAFGLAATDVDAELTGAGNVSVTVSGDLTGSITGLGSLSYKGTPTNIDVDISGAGQVIDAN